MGVDPAVQGGGNLWAQVLALRHLRVVDEPGDVVLVSEVDEQVEVRVASVPQGLLGRGDLQRGVVNLFVSDRREHQPVTG
jgi:hypothetical protein